MNNKPLLLFPRPSSIDRFKFSPQYFENTHYPSKERIIELNDSKISNLERVFHNQTARLSSSSTTTIPEMLLVLEVVGDVKDFFGAVRNTPGMEFLSVMQNQIPPDEDFYMLKDNERIEGDMTTRLFLTMTNQSAIRELRSYWNEFKKEKDEQNFRQGTAKFKDLFSKLKDIRPYSVIDRFLDTGMDEYLDQMRTLNDGLPVKFEIELAYKNSPARNNHAFQEISNLIEQYSGAVIQNSRVEISEIGYHAFIAEAPINCFNDLSENTDVTFLKSQQVIHFRPVGQSIYTESDPQELNTFNDEITILPNSNQPIIALLDGVPLENHTLLANRLIIDDPDEIASGYLSNCRVHGTAMASLILNGDLENPKFSNRPIYVSPILKSYFNDVEKIEMLPEDKLPIDLIHSALKRMFEGDNMIDPTAPSVRVINLSIGDPYRPFQRNMSTWARAIDWFSYKYNVLFIISAGNFTEDLTLQISNSEFDPNRIQNNQEETIKSIIQNSFNRRILSPSESINSLTVGAAHNDEITNINFHQRIDLIQNKSLLSPISRIGFGYNNSIKPDILMPGGRKLFRKHVIQRNNSATELRLEGNFNGIPPGNKVALPGSSGDGNYTGYLSGTSNAAALTSHLAGQLYDMLQDLNDELDFERKIPSKYFTVILKSLLVHGAEWGSAQELMKTLLRQQSYVSPNTVNKHIYPYLGNGLVNSEKVLYCTNQRVTLIGYGELSHRDNQNAHIYSLPLPPSMGQIILQKKLTITLSWLSPLNFNSSQYRKAHLFFDNLQSNNDYLALERNGSDYRVGLKGTVQHDILTGDKADAYQDGDTIQIKVSCRQDASGLSINELIPYCISVTLEIQENSTIEIYEEVKVRLQTRVTV